jgi:hypothetical protein
MSTISTPELRKRLPVGPRVAIVLSVILGLIAIGLAVLTVARIRAARRRPIEMLGTVLRQDTDPRKQLPISDVQISISNGPDINRTRSNSAGFFNLTLPKSVARGQPVTLIFRHPDYHLLVLQQHAGDQIVVARMTPSHPEARPQTTGPQTTISNVAVRYSIKTTSSVTVGSAVKTFEVPNQGNVPCNGRTPCSPGGKWKASVSSASLDAGDGNEFRNARVTCIAGPCPFTEIVHDGFSRGGPIIDVSVRNWSDTATYLMEAEVVHPQVTNASRHSYPVIFGQALNFNLPPAAEGPSIEAEINGEPIVFPLGPDLCLSWADCSVRVAKDETKGFRCELKPGYRFK